jgi:molybdopterin molybdotransferase
MAERATELDAHGALAALCRELIPIDAREVVTTPDACGRVLATDIVAPSDVPAFPNAAMDGYAVRAADCSANAHLRVEGAALAGHPYERELPAAAAIRIMTGAPIPPGADAVVMQELALRDADRVSFASPVQRGLNVRPRGGHVRGGETVIAARTTLNAAEVGLATLVGAAQVEVFRRLRVGMASTGDELFDPPAPLGVAGGYDGNRPMLAAAARAAGFVVTDLGICRDRAADFARLIEQAQQQGLDALVISGGSALGDADVVRQAESVRFVPVNLGPGRGVTFGTFARDTARLVLLGLPGNAVAAFVMFQLLALPALRYLAGGRGTLPLHLPVPLAVDVSCKPGRIDYQRGRFEHGARGELTVRPLERQGSGMLRTLAEGDALLAVGPQGHYRAGESIPVVLLAAVPH